MITLSRLHCVLLMFVLAGLWAYPGQSWGQAAETIGQVLAVEGVAEVQAPQATAWERLRFRDAIRANDTVRTDASGRLKVLLRDDSVMTLGERSEMQFSEFLLTPQQRRSVVNLVLGKVRVLTGGIFGAGSATEVRTANTVAGVRGTTFVVSFVPPSTTEVSGFDGVVTVRHLNAAIAGIEPVPSNFRTRVVGESRPGRATPIPPAEQQALQQELKVTEQIPAAVTPTDAREAGDSTQRDQEREVTSIVTPLLDRPVDDADRVAEIVSKNSEIAPRTTKIARGLVGRDNPQVSSIIDPSSSPSAIRALEQLSQVQLIIKLPR